jgi:hypothetical protein
MKAFVELINIAGGWKNARLGCRECLPVVASNAAMWVLMFLTPK